MKKCSICGCDIINGKNGCTMYDTCFECKPIHYYAKPRQGSTEYFGDYEEAILEKQEEYFD